MLPKRLLLILLVIAVFTFGFVAGGSREAAKKNWAEFGSDPEWRKVKAESEAAGKIVSKIDSVYMKATDYSELK